MLVCMMCVYYMHAIFWVQGPLWSALKPHSNHNKKVWLFALPTHFTAITMEAGKGWVTCPHPCTVYPQKHRPETKSPPSTARAEPGSQGEQTEDWSNRRLPSFSSGSAWSVCSPNDRMITITTSSERLLLFAVCFVLLSQAELKRVARVHLELMA